jgi:hypothetical protein
MQPCQVYETRTKAPLLIVNPEFREIFSSLETNEGQFDFLQREHDEREHDALLSTRG